ncbi:MAG: hypothetical protein KC591_08845 [Gemmatimonadetes bacterium]|nr:hypothetical protein [Gemmatimonadota bacterium]
MRTWRILAVVPLAALFAAGCLQSNEEQDYGNLLTEPDQLDGAIVAIQIQPVPRNGIGPSDATQVGRGNWEWDPNNPDPELNFHEIRSANASYNWHGQHQSTGSKASTYTDDVNGGHRHEHISSGPDASLFKPYGSSHITEGEYASLYQ